MPEAMYKKPGWFTKNVFNRSSSRPPRPGDRGAGFRRRWRCGDERVARCEPTRSTHSRSTAARICSRLAATTQWVRNLRAAGGGELRSGRKVRHFHAEEVADSDKLPLLRLYMDKWSWEVKGFMGIDADAPDEELRRIAPDHPAFVLSFED